MDQVGLFPVEFGELGLEVILIIIEPLRFLNVACSVFLFGTNIQDHDILVLLENATGPLGFYLVISGLQGSYFFAVFLSLSDQADPQYQGHDQEPGLLVNTLEHDPTVPVSKPSGKGDGD